MLERLEDLYLPLKEVKRAGVACKPVTGDALLTRPANEPCTAVPSPNSARRTLTARTRPVSTSTAFFTSAKVPRPSLG